MTNVLYAFVSPSASIEQLEHEVELLERELGRLRRKHARPDEIEAGQEIMAAILNRGMAINLIKNGHDPYQWCCEHLESAGLRWEGGYTAVVFRIAPNVTKYEEMRDNG